MSFVGPINGICELREWVILSTGVPHFIILGFIALHRCCVFYKLKAGPSISKKIRTHFIAVVCSQTHTLSEVGLDACTKARTVLKGQVGAPSDAEGRSEY